MGKLKNGAFGHITGRIGNLVCYTVNGENIAREVGQISKPPSIKQLANYQGTTLINRFQKTILPFLNVGFPNLVSGNGNNAYNTAMSYNKKQGIKGDYPSKELDYPKLLASQGSLPPALSPVARILPTGVEFNWQMPVDLDYNYQSNRAMMLLYFPEGIDLSGLPHAVWELSGAKRHMAIDFISLDAKELGKRFEAYIAFISDDRQVSDSVWVPVVE